jgi:hypothetical protein
MGFKKEILPKSFSSGDQLTEDMIGIGMLFAGEASKDPNIENTLVAASIEGLIQGDGRVMSLLTDWLTVHRERINVERLYQILRVLDSKKYQPVLIYWAANAQRFRTDPRFSKMRELYKGPRINYFKIRLEHRESYDGTDFLIQKNGEDERFTETCIRVPNKTLRHRPRDILSPEELAKRHLTYRYRIMLGSNTRADLWAALKRDSRLTPAELARTCFCSYKSAYMARRDFDLIRGLRTPDLSAA